MRAAQGQFLRLLERAVVDFSRAENSARDLLGAGLQTIPEAGGPDATAERNLEYLIVSLNHWKESCAVVRATLHQEEKDQ